LLFRVAASALRFPRIGRGAHCDQLYPLVAGHRSLLRFSVKGVALNAVCAGSQNGSAASRCVFAALQIKELRARVSGEQLRADDEFARCASVLALGATSNRQPAAKTARRSPPVAASPFTAQARPTLRSVGAWKYSLSSANCRMSLRKASNLPSAVLMGAHSSQSASEQG
jgi:hypothetical protein